jgi:glutathione S-transferase
MKVYGSATSACTHKVLMVLAEKGAKAELIEVDVLRGEDKRPEHLARMPFGEIPAIVDGGFVLYESRAIIRYLDQRLPGASLTPSDPRQRGLMEQWISVEQSYVSGPVWDLVRAGPVYDIIRQSPAVDLFPPPPSDERVAEARAELKRAFGVLDAALANGPYLAGPRFSLAEVTFLPYLTYLSASGGADLIAEHRHLAEWWERISARPTWRVSGKVLTDVK